MAERLIEVLRDWDAVIGLEIHTELTTLESKMFCGCAVEFGGEPNTRVCPVCLGMPGSLPVPNEKAVEATVLAGLALECDIAPYSRFHRKNYFYPDMPKDYQISQYDLPFCLDGHLDVEVGADFAEQRVDRSDVEPLDDASDAADGAGGEGGYVTRIGVTRIHLEEDTGKMVHVGGSEGRIAGATHSLVDFNRAGTGLMELVTEPDIRTPEEARRFAQKLRLTFLALGVSDCSMEEGSLRVDANVSVRRRGIEEFGTKAEIKNMNSFKALHDGLAHEIVRQAEELEAGGRVVQQTRHWDASARRTSSLRSKEEAHDYRYFPEPDMAPFAFDAEYVEAVRAKLPELPDAKKRRFVEAYDLPSRDAGVLAEDAELAAYFEEAAGDAPEGAEKQVANWMLGDLAAHLNETGRSVRETQVAPEDLAGLVALIGDGDISGKQAKDVFAVMLETGDAPSGIVEREGMRQLSDAGELEAVVDRVIERNPDETERYRDGKTGLIGFFVGQVMKETRGQANPQVVNELLREKLGG